MKLPLHNAEGKELKAIEVDDSVFGIEPHQAVLHQAFVAGRANRRAGTAQTKSRGEVQGSTRKIRMQKYTGRARAGSARSPTRVGGGVAFGPVQRDYSQALPKKMKRLAIRSALSGKVADGQLIVIDRLEFDQPKTKEMIRVLRNVGIQRSTLIVTAQSDRHVLVSARNLERTLVLPAAHLNVVDMLNHQSVLITEDAVRITEQLWGADNGAAAPKKPAARAKAAAKAEPKAKKDTPVAKAETKAEKDTAVAKAETKAEKEASEAKAEAPEAKAEAPAAEKPKRAAAKAKTAAADKKPASTRKKADAKDDKPKPAARTRKKADGPAADADAAEKPKPRRRTTKKTEEGEA